MFVVGKSFIAEGITRRTGEVVKASRWRHVKRLLEQRYLSVFDGEPVKCAKCGRMFANDELLQDHIRIDHPEPETKQEEQQEFPQQQKTDKPKPEAKKEDTKPAKEEAKANTTKQTFKRSKPKATTKRSGK